MEPTATMSAPKSMDAPSTFAACPCSTGNGNLKEQFDITYKGGAADFSNPCCSPSLAYQWEKERDFCLEGDIAGCLGCGVLSRLTHVAALIGDTVASVAAPIICVGGSVTAGCACCFSVIACSVAPCYACCLPESTENVKESARKARIFAGNVLSNSAIISASLVGACASDIVCLPVNVIAPEILNAFCCQQQRLLLLNRGAHCHYYC